MSAQTLQPAKHYAKQICMFLKKMPGKYADDPKDVQDALGLSDEEFKLGLDWCIERKIIELNKDDDKEPEASSDAPATSEKSSDDETEKAEAAEAVAV
jgi:hypothetical protein